MNEGLDCLSYGKTPARPLIFNIAVDFISSSLLPATAFAKDDS